MKKAPQIALLETFLLHLDFFYTYYKSNFFTLISFFYVYVF